MNVFRAYATGTSAYLTLQALPLLLTPNLIVSLCVAEPRRTTDVETYLCRSLGLALLVLATLALVLSGAIPGLGVVDMDPTARTEAASNSSTAVAGSTWSPDPYARPTLIITTAYHASTAAYLYAQLTQAPAGWNLAFTAGMAGSVGLFCLGTWVALFGDDKGRTSARTGADKRTGNFPFENKESAREKRREEKEREKEREREKEKERGKKRSVLRSSSSK